MQVSISKIWIKLGATISKDNLQSKGKSLVFTCYYFNCMNLRKETCSMLFCCCFVVVLGSQTREIGLCLHKQICP
jgi:hypothetical protein